VIDRPKVAEILARLRTYRSEPGRLAGLPKEALLADPDRVGSAKFRRRLRCPGRRACAPPKRWKPLCAPWPGSEIGWSTLYWDVDDELVYEYLQTSFGDFDRFAAAVAEAAG